MAPVSKAMLLATLRFFEADATEVDCARAGLFVISSNAISVVVLFTQKYLLIGFMPMQWFS